MTTSQRFHRVALFEGLSEAQRLHLEDVGAEVAFLRGEDLFRQGDPADALYIVLRGRVKLVRAAPTGASTLLDVLSVGDDLDLASIVEGKSHAATAKTLCDGTAWRLPTAAFRRLLAEWPLLAGNLLKLMATRHREVVEDLSALAVLNVEGRLCRALSDLSRRYGILGDCRGVILDLGLTRQDLADLTGTTLETAIRALNRLKGQGHLTWEGRRFFIPDVRTLETVVAAA
jgi:CRP/FNR family transcriptional regulator, nitrogen oxide reductase regulator